MNLRWNGQGDERKNNRMAFHGNEEKKVYKKNYLTNSDDRLRKIQTQ